MTNYRPSLWRLFLIFLLLQSHVSVMCDIMNDTITEWTVPRTDNISANNSQTEGGEEETDILLKKTMNELFTSSFFKISRKHAKNETKFSDFVTTPQSKNHSEKMVRLRHRKIDSTGKHESTENTKILPTSVNRTSATRNKNFRSMLKKMENMSRTGNVIISPKEIRNVSFARIFFSDITKYLKNRSEAKMLEIFHRTKSTNYNPFQSRYAYFTEDSNFQRTENTDDSFVGCYKTHDTCHTSGRLHQSRRRITCSCDEDCEDYGNCCVDHKFVNVTNETMNKIRYSCSKTGTYTGYFALASCPSFWRNAYVRSLCEGTNNDETDVFLQVPVSNRDTLLTYSNIYCAFCNGDRNIEFWSVDARCPNSSASNFTDNTDLRLCSNHFRAPQHHLQSKEPANIHLKKCRHDVINKCPQHWMFQLQNQTAMEIAVKCALLYTPVSLFGIWTSEATIYKNEFCAICNGVTDIRLFCPVVKMPRSPPQGSPLPILLDMDFTSGGMIVGSQNRCPHMQLYDPWKQKCRSVACRPYFEYKEGQCVLQKSYSDNLMKIQQRNQPFNESSSSDCLQVIFSFEEVSVLENGTLVVVSEGSIYQPEEYESTDNSTVTVCIRRGTYRLYVSTFTSFQGYLTIAGMGISLAFLLIRIILSTFFPEQHKLPPKIVLFLSITLFFSQLLFIFGVYQTANHTACVVIGILMHYGFLSSFFWTNVLAYDIWKTFGSSQVLKKVRCGEKQLMYYCMHGWINPLFIVILAGAFDWIGPYELLKPRYGKSVCWISNKAALATFFGFPLALLLISNMVFFLITSMEIRKTTKATKFAHDSCPRAAKNRRRFGLYCKLAFIMGLMWIFGFIAAFSGSSVLWYFFIAFNSIQGVYIFVAFTHFKIPSSLIPKKSSQWTLSVNSLTSRSSTTRSATIAKV